MDQLNMKISKVFILGALLISAINISGCSKQDAAASQYTSPIRAKINEEIANMACAPAHSFPFSSRERPEDSCFGCDKFVEAGLVTKTVEEDPFASNTQQNIKPDVRFELTELGNETYIAGGGDSAYGLGGPRFCFGKVKVNQITRLVGPVMFNNERVIGIRYIAELESPHPFIFDSRAKILGIKLPNASPITAGKPVLYPEANISAIFNPGNPNDFWLDASLEIGT
jgi:hypothetical protein